MLDNHLNRCDQSDFMKRNRAMSVLIADVKERLDERLGS
jgi:hypothetical protein